MIFNSHSSFDFTFINFFSISENVIDKKTKMEGCGTTRKLERQIEEELGDDYVVDLKKNYDLPDAYKYDKIPEFWNGRNIQDFIDPEILEVYFFP